MRHLALSQRLQHQPNLRGLLLAVLGAIVVVDEGGCSKKKVAATKPISEVIQVEVGKPEVRTIIRNVGQPSFVEAYEQTAIYAKLPAYVQKWNVDIGDRLKKGQELATLFIPELVKEYEQKSAMVKQEQAMIEQAEKLVAVAAANVRAAGSLVKQAQANVGQSLALVSRWDSEVGRLSTMVRDRVVDKQILAESQRQLQANQASSAAAEAAVDTAQANQIAAQANLEKAKVDVDVAKARWEVAKADRERVKALNGYLTLTAPYDGIVILRNVNTGDFVLPATGDPSASPRSRDEAATKATPLYVVARTDMVRVYVDVAEGDANSIVCKVDKLAGDARPVTKGQVRIFALDNAEIPAEATRCTWALNFKSRTLRTEIDLPNPGARLLPGMYAFGKLVIERPNVKAVPAQTILEIGNQIGCYLFVDGKAVWTPLQTGVSDGTWTEVLRKQNRGQWLELQGTEEIIASNLSELTEGQAVKITVSNKQ